MLLVYQNKDNIHYAYYSQLHLPYDLLFFETNKRGQTLLCAIITYKSKLYVVSSLNDYIKIYKTPIFVRFTRFIKYKNRKFKKGLGDYLVRVGNRLNRY